ncbi:MAG: hypothetical protein H7843_08430 [Nitrospirota bacterium]|uniref:Uncharacterized protein n=1 Tax=Candidatus Magnetominusculus xianensis TaxID=1748249 RepID=A0ABR5SKE1_9BACT|nr:hypothetical protein [Candidatus Magnetominusculus xianensis]KWT94358.1 hypothetical protein ASN18_0243 [Candidatus Magnetominusculus xianensis]MBF0403992.1 hypothetical protein [Nitrospirota bacterium]
MYKRFMTLLRVIANEIISSDMNFDESKIQTVISDYNITDLYEDLSNLEGLDIMSDEDIDTLKAFLAYVVSKDTYMDRDDVYSMIFGNGKRILWH